MKKLSAYEKKRIDREKKTGEVAESIMNMIRDAKGVQVTIAFKDGIVGIAQHTSKLNEGERWKMVGASHQMAHENGTCDSLRRLVNSVRVESPKKETKHQSLKIRIPIPKRGVIPHKSVKDYDRKKGKKVEE